MPKAKEVISQENKLTKASQESKTIKKSKKESQNSQGSATSSPAKKELESSMPKKTISGYMAFINSRRPNFVEENPNLSMCEAVSALAKVWNAMSDVQKKQYDVISQTDRKRYEKEMAELDKKGYFINKNGENSKQLYLAERAKKTAIKPKKTQTSYMAFVAENFKKVQAAQPELSMTEISKVNGKQWGALSEVEKRPYNAVQAQDQKRYDAQFAELGKKGYFTLEDGSKSCDQVQKKFKYPQGTTMPPRAQSSYEIYVSENIQKIMDKQSLSRKEARDVCAQVWEKLNDKQKLKYEKGHEVDVSRNQKQIVSLQQNGYFLYEDGSKSTD